MVLWWKESDVCGARWCENEIVRVEKKVESDVFGGKYWWVEGKWRKSWKESRGGGGSVSLREEMESLSFRGVGKRR